MMKARFCYQTVTPESASNSDTADNGFYIPGFSGGKFSVADLSHEEHIKTGDECTLTTWTLREVIEAACNLGITEDVGNWLESIPTIEDYGTGAYITYSLHIDGVTDATYNRIIKLLTKRR